MKNDRKDMEIKYSFSVRPAWIVILVLVIAFSLWGAALFSIGSQIGKPFPGFYYNPERVVSSFTPPEFTGMQAGLRPWDVIMAVNDQHWREMPRLVRQADIGEVLVYTVDRRGELIRIAVPTMEFTGDILWHILPAYLLSSLVFLAIGIYVFWQNPTAPLNRYLLAYLLVWAIGSSIIWESFISQNKWMAYLLVPYAIIAPAAGWIFFWNFPAGRSQRNFSLHRPVTRAIILLAATSIFLLTSLRLLANITGLQILFQVLVFLHGWPYFLIFAVGSIPMKSAPLLMILVRSHDRVLRRQAAVMLIGLLAGLSGWYLFVWAPASIHVPPIAYSQWGGLIPTLYPLAIGYAIVRYRLLDIRVFIRKGLIYSLLTALLTAVFVLLSLLIGYAFQYTTGRQSWLSMVLPALLVAFMFQPLRSRVQTFVDRSFFRKEYEIRHTITRFSSSLSTLREQNEVVQLVHNTIMNTLGARHSCLWLPVNDHFIPIPGSSTSARAVSRGSALATYLSNERRLYFPFSDDSSAEAAELQSLGASLAVPLFASEKLSGILTLSERTSGVPYNQEDLELLSMLAASTAFALENARLHEEKMSILRDRFFHVGAVQEEERRRIARELHDGVGPSLAGLNIRLKTVQKVLEREGNPAAAELSELAQQAQQNIHDVRRLIYDLRPAALDELGLVPALTEYLRRYQKEQNIQTELIIPGSISRLSPELETALFRISQEALSNIARHAGASRIEFCIEQTQTEIILHIRDNGHGFNPDTPLHGNHIGLWSMQKRVEQFGGCFQVHSAPGKGTSIIVRIPLLNTPAGDQPVHG